MAVIVRRSTLVAGFALAILALTAFAPVACAATYTWGVSGSGGDGTWSTAGIWNGSTWNNATPDSAVFAGTGGTVSLTTTQTTGSITFDAFTGGFTIGTLGGQTLRINGGGMTMNAGAGAVTINSPVTLGAVQSWTNNSTSLLTVAGNVTNGGNLLTVAGSGNTTIAGGVSGAGGLTMSGAGTLTLSGTNSYTGATTVNGGTLALTGGWAGTMGNITVSNTAAISIQSGSYALGNNTFFVGVDTPGTVNQTGGVVTFAGGVQLLVGNGGAAGAYTLSGGTVTTAASTTFGVMLGVNTNASGTFTMTGGALNMTAATGGGGDATLFIGRSGQTGENGQSGAFIQSGGVASVGLLSMGGNGSNAGTGGSQVLTLTGGTFAANQFPRLSAGNSNVATITIGGSADVTLPAFPTTRGTGATATLYFNGGTLRPAAASATYMSGLTSASIQSGGSTIDVASGRDITIGQSLLADGTSPGGGLTKNGVGTLTLSGSNSYTGATQINAGALALGNSGALGSSGTISFGGGTLQFSASNTTDYSGRFSAAANQAYALDTNGQNVSLGTALTSTGGSLTKLGTGTLTLSAANTFTGTTRIGAGTLTLSNAAALQNSTLDMNAADAGTIAFAVSGTNTYALGGLIGSRNVVTSGAVVLSVGGNATSGTYSGVLSGGGALVKSGSGTLTLSEPNSYTGATTVNGGTLVLTGGRSGTMGSITVSNTAAIAIQSGSYALGNNQFAVGVDTMGTVNQTGGVVTFSSVGTQLLIGNSVGGVGSYVLSGGTVTTGASTTFGVMLGVNANSSGTFTMTGGALNMTAATGGGGDATLSIGRSSSTGENGQSGAFIQSGGVASVGLLSMGGNGSNAGTGGTQVLTLTGGTFAANQFPRLSAGNSNVATITIGGSADVTLPAFPTTRGTGATATLYFNGGTLRPAAASATYMSGLTSASIQSGGSTIDVASGRDITIGQSLLADGTSPGGGLTKNGVGTLTLSGSNTYTGPTVARVGVLQLGKVASLYGGTTASWVQGNINVKSGATLSLNVGGTGEFGTSELTTLLTNLASSTSSSTGLNAGATIGFDTSNAAGGSFTVSNAIADTTGGSGGALGLAKLGAGTLTLAGSNSYTGPTTINAGVLQIGVSGTGTSLTIANASFETPTTSTFIYTPTGASVGWTFDAASGIARNTFFTTAPPAGSQAGFIQATGSFYQSITTATAGFYRVTFQAQGRGGALGPDGVIVQMDGVTSGSWAATDVSQSQWLTYTSTVYLTSGSHTLTFLGNNTGGGDKSVSIDNVRAFQSTTGGSLPSTTAVSLAGSGATFDLNGTAQTIGSLSGIAGSSVTKGFLTVGGDGTSTTFAGSMSAATLTKVGVGTLTLSGSNSFLSDQPASVAINAGVLALGNSGALGSSGTIAFGGGTLQFSASNTIDYSGRFSTAASQAYSLDTNGQNVSLGTALSSSGGSLTKLGSGTLTLSTTNTFSGSTTVSAGVLALSGSGSIGSSSGVNISGSGARLDISGASGDRTVVSLEGVAGSSVLLGGNALTADNATNKTFAGVISGSGGFTKAGAGVLTLSDAQAFTGTARVDAGTLAISGSSTLATANRIYVASGASLDATAAGLGVVGGQTLGGYGTVSGNLAVLAGGTLSPGGSVGTLTETGNTTWHGGMHYLFEVNVASGTAGGPNGWDLFNTSGSLTLVDGNVSPIAIDLTSLSGTSSGSAADFDPNIDYAWKFVVAGSEITTFNAGWFTVNSTAFQNLPSNPERFYVARGDQLGAINATGSANELYVVYAAVPEPGTLALAGIGIAAVGWRLRRRRR